MATAVEDRRTRLRLNERTPDTRLTPLAPQSRSELDDINLLLSVEQPNAVTQRTIQVFAGETIRNLKIQLRKKEYFTNKHCLVFGHRELLENETLGQVTPLEASLLLRGCCWQLAVESGDGRYLHVMAKLSDVERLEVVTDKQKQSLTKEPYAVSALTHSFKRGSLDCSTAPSAPLLLCGCVMETGKELMTPTGESKNGDPIVHLVIRKSTKVHWHQLKGEKFEIRISADSTVEEVKQKLAEVAVGFDADEHALVKSGYTLQPGMSLSELGVQKGDVLEIVEVPLTLEECLEPAPSMMSPKGEMPEQWQRAKDALALGIRPKLTTVGTGGSYFISAKEGMNLAVFKPEDEEPRAPNNPKGHKGSPTGEGLRRGVRPGEGATREVIAYTLDHGHFSGVPPTTMASLRDTQQSAHRKVGSFQQFVPHDVDCEEMGPSNFPVQEVHKICVLDIRLANTDRNAGNILASRKEGQWVLTPIDHGYCLPSSFEDINFEWMFWPQAKIPFNEATQQYISQLDAERDLKLLAEAGLPLRPECVRVFRVCTMLLKASLSHGLTPHELGLIMCRQRFTMSPLEKLHKGALKQTLSQMYGISYASGREGLELDEELYLKNMRQAFHQYLDETAADVLP